MTAVTPDAAVLDRARPKRLNRATILLLGVVLAPLVIGFLVFPGGELTEESAVRMAFAAVAGQTVAILSAAAALVITLRRDRRLTSVLFFTVVLLLVTSWAISSMTSAGERLLTRLDRVADVSLLNG